MPRTVTAKEITGAEKVNRTTNTSPQHTHNVAHLIADVERLRRGHFQLLVWSHCLSLCTFLFLRRPRLCENNEIKNKARWVLVRYTLHGILSGLWHMLRSSWNPFLMNSFCGVCCWFYFFGATHVHFSMRLEKINSCTTQVHACVKLSGASMLLICILK